MYRGPLRITRNGNISLNLAERIPIIEVPDLHFAANKANLVAEKRSTTQPLFKPRFQV